MHSHKDKVKASSKRIKKYNVYKSYSDMMAGLLLLFLLVMIVSMFQSQVNYQEAIQEEKNKYIIQKEYSDALISKQNELEEQAAIINAQNEELLGLQEKLNSQNVSITELEEALVLVSEQSQAKIEKILGVKADVIASLTQEFKKNKLDIEIDQDTGAMELSSNVMFGYNTHDLTEEGKEILNEVLPVYCQVLLSKEYLSNVAEIIVDGYTDTDGSYEYNLELSQKRSLSVANHLLSICDEFLDEKGVEELKSKLTVNGHSMNNPILNDKGEVDKDASRRVEVKFRLKDEEAIKEISDMVFGDKVGTADSNEGPEETEVMTEEKALESEVEAEMENK